MDSARAQLLARLGAVAESVRWFGGLRQHEGPWEIPLELFLARVAALRVDCDRVVVLGTSFGAEVALLIGALSEDVDAVVGFAPSDVVWAGVRPDGSITSHWTLSGEPLPFVPFDEDWAPADDPPTFLGLYEASQRRYPTALEEATIRAETIDQVVLVAGGDDQVWPSLAMAERVRQGRARCGLDTTVLTDPGAGHRTVLPGEDVVAGGARMRRGGTETADRRLGRLAWTQLQAMLTEAGPGHNGPGVGRVAP